MGGFLGVGLLVWVAGFWVLGVGVAGGGVPVWRLGAGRRLLLSAWVDVGSGFYEWAILKSWSAAVFVLAAGYGGLGPGGGWASAGYLAAGLLEPCGLPGEVLGCASTLDALAAPLQHPEAVAVLGLELGYGRREALDSIECALRVGAAVEGCLSGGGVEPAVPAGLVSEGLERVSKTLGEASVVSVGGVYLVVYGGARGLPYSERVRRFPAPLPPVRVLLLAPEEAGVLLSLPPWRLAAKEFLRDDYGLEALGPGLVGG